MKIRLIDLPIKPCDKYYDYIKEHYDDSGEFDPMEILETLDATASEVSWLISEVEECRTTEWFDYFKSLNPSVYTVAWLIRVVKECGTIEWFDYYKSLNPFPNDQRRVVK